MTRIILSYYAALLIGSLLIFLLGHFVLRWFRFRIDSIHAACFAKFLTGLTVATTIYAAAVTRLNTIQLFFVPIGLFLGWSLLRDRGDRSRDESSRGPFQDAGSPDDSGHPEKPVTRRTLAIACELLIVVSFYFAWECNTMVSGSSAHPIFPNADILYAARSVEVMNITGVEGMRASDLPAAVAGSNTPYHYFEYWYTALMARFTGGLAVYNFKLNQIPFFLLLTYIGLCALARQIRPLNSWIKIACLLFLFYHVPLTLSFIPPPFENAGTADNFLTANVAVMEALYFKMIPRYLWVIAGLLFAFSRQWTGAVCCLLALPIIVTSSAPAVFSGVFAGHVCLLALSRIPRWSLDRKLLMRNLACTVCTALGILIFYQLTESKESSLSYSSDFLSIGSIKSNVLNVSHLTGALKALGWELAQLVVLCLPIMLFLIVDRRRLFGRGGSVDPVLFGFFVLLGFIVVGSLGIYLLLNFDYGIFVFYRLVNIPILNITTALVVLAAAAYRPRTLGISYVVLFVLVIDSGVDEVATFVSERKQHLIAKYSEHYLMSVAREIEHLNPYGVFMRRDRILGREDLLEEYDEAFTNTNYYQLTSPIFYYPGQYLHFWRSNVIVAIISDVPEVPMYAIDHTQSPRDYLPYLSFSRFIKRQKEEGAFRSLTQSRLDFIREHQIEYLIVSPYVTLPPSLEALAKRSITDPVSGERFLVLDWQKAPPPPGLPPVDMAGYSAVRDWFRQNAPESGSLVFAAGDAERFDEVRLANEIPGLELYATRRPDFYYTASGEEKYRVTLLEKPLADSIPLIRRSVPPDRRIFMVWAGGDAPPVSEGIVPRFRFENRLMVAEIH